MKYFLGQDLYGTWYCLPETERETFDRLCKRLDAYNFDAWNSIAEYKVDLEQLTFENPIWRD